MITITNKNIYLSDFPITSLSSLDKIEKVHINDVVNFLSDYVELGESVTFKRLFHIVSSNLDKFNEIFYSALGGYALEPYLQEIENNPTEPIESEFLEIHWFCDKYMNELTIAPSMHGVSEKESEVYALDFVSLNNLKNLKVRINKSVEIFDYDKTKSIDEITINDQNTIYMGDKSFTLFELYDAIFHEISFHGGPQEKKERFSEIEDSMKEVEKMEKDELTNKSITFDEMMENFDKKDKYLVKFKDLRYRVEEDRVSNTKNLTKLKNCLKEKIKIYDIIENSDDNLEQYYKKLTDIEYNMQILYGEEEDISYHRFWETPKCTCPKIDNLELYPSKNPLFDTNCPIHKKI